MYQERETEYLMRPYIEGALFTIENNHIRITSPSTIHAEAKIITILCQADLLSLYKKVLQKAKTHKVRISYSQHIRKQILERWNEYESRCIEAGIMFATIFEQAKVVRERGLHYGTVDDTELAKLQKLCSKYGEFFYRNSIASQMSEIYYHLNSLDSDLSTLASRLDTIYL